MKRPLMKNVNRYSARFAVALLVSATLFSCRNLKEEPVRTIIPERVVDLQPSWDNGVQDSGIKGFVPGKGFEISVAAALYYNSLIGLYGAEMVPPVAKDYGVSYEGDKIFLSEAACVHFMVLNGKKKNGVK